MYCRECGAEIPSPENSEYCPQCGEPLAEPSEDDGRTAETNTEHDGADGRESTPPPDTASATQSSSSRWRRTQLLAVGGGVLAGISAFLPWVTARTGGQSVDALATPFGTPLLAAAAIVTFLSVATWGRGFGWLTMLLAGLGGAGITYVSVVVQSTLSSTYAMGTIQVHGNDVSVAAVSPGVGVTVTIVAGLVVVAGALLGILTSLTS